MAKVTVSLPADLKTTASDRAALKSAFQTTLDGVIKRHRRPDDDSWNIGRVTAEVIVVSAARPGAKPAAKRKATKQASKKK